MFQGNISSLKNRKKFWWYYWGASQYLRSCFINNWVSRYNFFTFVIGGDWQWTYDSIQSLRKWNIKFILADSPSKFCYATFNMLFISKSYNKIEILSPKKQNYNLWCSSCFDNCYYKSFCSNILYKFEECSSFHVGYKYYFLTSLYYFHNIRNSNSFENQGVHGQRKNIRKL